MIFFILLAADRALMLVFVSRTSGEPFTSCRVTSQEGFVGLEKGAAVP